MYAAEKFLVALGESEGEKSIVGHVGSFILEGPFFEVGIAATVGAFVASTIAEQLGANKLEVEWQISLEALWEVLPWAPFSEVTTCNFLMTICCAVTPYMFIYRPPRSALRCSSWCYFRADKYWCPGDTLID